MQTLTLPENSNTALPVNPNPASESYTERELSLWQKVRANRSYDQAVAKFEKMTGKKHDPFFLI